MHLNSDRNPIHPDGEDEFDFGVVWGSTKDFLVGQFNSMPESYRSQWASMLESLAGRFYAGDGWNAPYTQEVCVGDRKPQWIAFVIDDKWRRPRKSPFCRSGVGKPSPTPVPVAAKPRFN